MRLRDKVALITGGTTGIGAATARLFHSEGAKVSSPARARRRRRRQAWLARHRSRRCRSGRRASVQGARRAGQGSLRRYRRAVRERRRRKFATLDRADEAHFDLIFNINVRGLYFMAKHAAPVIPNGGSIIFTGSTAGSKGGAGMSVYSATKAAVRSLARTLAAELAQRNIRVNVISPGVIETPILGKVGLAQEQLDGGSKARSNAYRLVASAGRRKWQRRRCILPPTPPSPRERSSSSEGATLTSDARRPRLQAPLGNQNQRSHGTIGITIT